MKRFFTIITFLLVYIGLFAQDPDDIRIDSFAGLAFGMSKDVAIEKIQAKKEYASTAYQGTDTYHITYITLVSIIFDACDLHFFNDELFSGIFTKKVESKEQSIELYKTIYYKLEEKYGTPVQKKDYLAGWQSNDFKAILLSIKNEDSQLLVRLTYLDRIKAGEKAKLQKDDL